MGASVQNYTAFSSNTNIPSF